MHAPEAFGGVILYPNKISRPLRKRKGREPFQKVLKFQFFFDILNRFVYGYADLFHRISITHGHRTVFTGIEIDGKENARGETKGQRLDGKRQNLRGA